MPTKKTTKKTRSGNSARTVRGKPFQKGHKFAWKPGQSGNPAGRPRDTITPHLREIVRQKYPGKTEETFGELIAGALVSRAINGDVRAIAEVFDRLEGKPQARLDVTHSDDQPRREWAEQQLQRVMEQFKWEREEAIEWMRRNTPTAAQWIN